MPEYPRRKLPSSYYKSYRLMDAARDGKLYIIKCKLCKKTMNFMARDLATIKDATIGALDLRFKCSKCDSGSYIEVDMRSPNPGDYGSLIIQRPAGQEVKQLWKQVLLGDC